MAAPSPLHAFPYDAFQRRAIEAIDRNVSLFVSAPTGSGKTVLADYVIETSMADGRRVIYTAPIKALSNQKYRDFSTRYGDAVGILTGDVTINPSAPLVIMTTEIYRNTLLEDPERLARYAWIIFDEIHYLDDPERGTVWEESIMFTPPHINLLCLSATIPNVEEMAQWIRQVHQRPVDVIEESKRPVPLTTAFQCHSQLLWSADALKREGYERRDEYDPRRHHGRGRHGVGWRPMERPNRVAPLVQHLRDEDRLPCIYFTFGRRRAEELAWELSGISLISQEERLALREAFRDLCEKYQLGRDRTAEAIGHLLDRGVAYHHAGLLPTMKEVIERCFASRLVKLIVTTETFALGINMPARSVVLDTLKKRSSGGFELLRRRDFMQMSGRAGRRGMDPQGYVYVRVNPHHVSFPEVVQLLQGQPEPVRSRFNMGYATLLNLYRHHKGEALLNIFPNTLYYFQTTGARRAAGLDIMRRKLQLLSSMRYTDRDGLTEKGVFASWLYGYELLLTELHVQRRLEELGTEALAVLMTALVYEPKPAMAPPKRDRLSRELADLCRQPLEQIHKEERRCRIWPLTKAPAFHLSAAVQAWMRKTPFHQLTKFCEADEGEIVRYFRMAVQLLRQLSESPATGPGMRTTATAALRRINRDVVDAEAQLRMG